MIAATLLGTAEFVRDLANVAAARHWVRDLLGPDHPVVDDVELCLGELVANSFRHAGGEVVAVSVLRADRVLRGEVVDAGAPGAAPCLRDAPDNDEFEYGRGLHVVSALTGGNWETWTGHAGHRTTWFELPDPSPDRTPNTPAFVRKAGRSRRR
jgi:anti-sigma regulatory factor (Ser/Thr protein kinase)